MRYTLYVQYLCEARSRLKNKLSNISKDLLTAHKYCTATVYSKNLHTEVI